MDRQEPQLASSERHTVTEFCARRSSSGSRSRSGGLTAAGAAAAGLASASGSSGSSLSSRDREVLQLALKFEQLQTAFYGQALKAGKLTGQVEAVRRGRRRRGAGAPALPGARTREAPPVRRPRSRSATQSPTTRNSSPRRSRSRTPAWRPTMARREYEPRTLQSVARVISVEARHAAWARGLAGKQPAPVPADAPITAAAA